MLLLRPMPFTRVARCGKRWASGRKVNLFKRDAEVKNVKSHATRNMMREVDERPNEPATPVNPVTQREVKIKSKKRPPVELKKYFVRGGVVVLCLDTAAWTTLGVGLHSAGLVDMEMAKAVVHSYPLHEFIPFETVRSVYVVIMSSFLWSWGFFVLRSPYLMVGGYIAAARIRRNVHMKGQNTFDDVQSEVLGSDYLVRHILVGVETFLVICLLSYILAELGVGDMIRPWYPAFVNNGIDRFSATIRSYIGTNDWPSDDQLMCFTIAVCVGEMYTILRTKVFSTLYRLGKSIMH